ncbi:MAG: TerB N-terminal domain-containing protein [Lachnospiraceae bacterium]|nr:TerB N-terminal domain-containing protein [Lachnospiraceae bacterium]
MEGKRKNGEGVRYTRIYSDVPLGVRKRDSHAGLPPVLRKMREIDGGRGTLVEKKARQFYLQAKLAEDYEDDVPLPEASDVPRAYYPTYESMDDRTLMSYFAWRTRVRELDMPEHSPDMFIHIYIYELLHNIGVTPQEGLQKLTFLRAYFEKLRPDFKVQMTRWIHDYIIYHHLTEEVKEPYFSLEQGQLVSQFLKGTCESSPEEFFKAAAVYSSYDPKRSIFYKKEPALFMEAVQAAYWGLDDFLEQTDSLPLTEMIFGPGGAYPVTLFQSAVFYPYRQIKEEVFRVSHVETYRCLNDGWFCETAYSEAEKSELLGEIVAETDCLMRKKTHFGHPIKSRMKDPYVSQKLSQILDAFLAKKEEEKHPRLVLNMSRLAGIRRDADVTMESLIVDEEEGETAGAVPTSPDEHRHEKHAPSPTEPEVLDQIMNALPTAGEKSARIEPNLSTFAEKKVGEHETHSMGMWMKEGDSSETDVHGHEPVAGSVESSYPAGLTEQEAFFLSALMEGKPWKAYIDENHIRLSMLVDSINDKLMEEIGDTVLEFDGEEPHLIEDYEEDVRDILGAE